MHTKPSGEGNRTGQFVTTLADLGYGAASPSDHCHDALVEVAERLSNISCYRR